MFTKRLLVLTALVTFHCQLTEGFGMLRSTNLLKSVELSKALKYGDNCSWEAEEYRQNVTMDGIMSDINNMLVMQVADTMVERDYKMCSAVELFICDKESLKCVCGDPGYEPIMGVNRSLYVLEGGNKCRWGTNTYCVPTEHTERAQRELGYAIDMKCKSGTSCKIGVDGDTCTIQSIAHHLVANHGISIFSNTRRITEEFLSGRACTCRADQVQLVEVQMEEGDAASSGKGINLNSKNDGTNGDVDAAADAEPAPRRKRSTSEAVGIRLLAFHLGGPTMSV